MQLNWKFSDQRAVFLLAYLEEYLRYTPVVEMWYIWVDDEYPMPPPKILTYAYSDLTVDLMQELTLLRGRGIYCIRITGTAPVTQEAPWVISPQPAAEPLILPLSYTSWNNERLPAHHFTSLGSWPIREGSITILCMRTYCRIAPIRPASVSFLQAAYRLRKSSIHT